MFLKSTRRIALLSILLAVTVLAGCSGQDKKLLADPRVGDLYAAEITQFSAVADDEGNTVEDGYGLLKVTGVSEQEIKVVTTAWYQDTKRGLLKELRKSPASQQWDLTDVITVKRAELAGLRDEGQIISVRRVDTGN
ncbi:hypothetical protein QLQ15_04100 [Lysobacter sp. LF1]|uniref:DUF1425 domain-containing protein n=1 Tax=Lysobacter stagni TaxID=3045172 RepID=A0ABT6XD69_9GAMM|nr:hypothetical protein [Lysobacter sp. LF1]MDI9238089.1 hypothetical protein [Lysobacter sp. LF1]